MNGLVNKNSNWASDALDNLNKSDDVFILLNNFANGFSSYLYKDNQSNKFYNGLYDSKSSYFDLKNKYINSNVGLPVVGEMFSGNDIDLGENNFVNHDLIENFNISNFYWTMNRYDNQKAIRINIDGNGFAENPNEIYGIRPVIYLDNNINIINGDGSPNNPYNVE